MGQTATHKRRRQLTLCLVALSAVALLVTSCAAESTWKPADSPLYTRWATDVSPDNVLPEYPRPMMVRKEWLNLNGLWDYAVTDVHTDEPTRYDGKILVPFPIESALSGVKRKATKSDRLWYRKTFELPRLWKQKRILLHFGAVDWLTTVYVNGRELGTHRGGYDPFTFDITEALKPSGTQEIVVAVWDPTDEGHQPRGKQSLDPRGFWYTAVTGIWQTVWLEPVPEVHIRDLQITPNIDSGTVKVRVRSSGDRVKVTVKDKGKVVAKADGQPANDIVLRIPNAKLWSPDSPHLYGLEVTLVDDGKVVDTVTSYFGMRKISLKRDETGTLRLALNNRILFQFGPLDQGWWPDGLYRPATDAALRYDIEVVKKLGFNMLRKHGKVEPQRFYYFCDKLGVLVWQDMTPGDIAKGADAEYGTDRNAQSAYQFELELKRMIETLYNHPSVVTWVIFNEGWGQYDTKRLTSWVKNMDPSRLVISASGFVDYGVGDIHDVHGYPGPTGAPWEPNRAQVLGEFGGLGLPVEGHLYEKRRFSYRALKNTEELTAAFEELLEQLKPYVSRGASAAVYTQISDVERELNGFMTYDREVIKMDPARVRRAVKGVCEVKPGSYNFVDIVPTSQKQPRTWRYTMQKPPANWASLGFDDADWLHGAGGFGNPKLVGPIVRTTWTTRDIWMRQTFELSDIDFDNPYLLIYHDFEQRTEVYLNGTLIAEGPEHQFAYTLFKLDEDARSLLHPGRNVLAVHAHKPSRRQYVDVGLLDSKD